VQYFGCKDEYANNQVDGESATYAGYGGTPDGMFLLKDMQVYVTLADGEDLRLGIRSDGRKSNGTRASDGTGWFKVDYFRLDKVDGIPADNGDDDLSLTESLIINPDFELAVDGTPNPQGSTSRGCPYGWQLATEFKGTSFGVNSDAVNRHQNNVCWFNNQQGPMPNNFELYQEIPADKLRPGHYQVKCKLWVEEDYLATTRLFANNNVQYYGMDIDYENNLTEGEENTFAGYIGGVNGNFVLQDMYVYVDLHDGEDLRVGIRSDNRRSDGTPHPDYKNGWFKCDYFRINKISDSVTGLEKILNKKEQTIYSNGIYDLQGRKKTNTLQRGIYIQNGRKVVNLE
jgi:hypothetical protein